MSTQASSFFAQDSIVFAKSDGVHVCKYYVSTNSWVVDLRVDSECAPLTEKALRLNVADDLPAFHAMTESQLSKWDNATRARMRSSSAFLVIAKISIKSMKYFVTLVPAETFPGVDVLFLRSSKGGSKEDKTLYTNIMKKLPSANGHSLFDSSNTVQLHMLQKGSFLKIAEVSHGHNREEKWLQAVCATSGSAQQKKRPRGQLVELPRVSADTIKKKVPKEEITLRTRYAGGKKHAAQRYMPVMTDLDTVTRNYMAPSATLSEYHLSKAKENFLTLLTAEHIAHAIEELRMKARSPQYGMNNVDIEDLLGSVASVFYEDIGWRMPPSPKPSVSSLDYLSVDVDQVIAII